MGRTRPAKKQHTKATDPPVQHSKPPSISGLLEKAQDLIVQCDYGLALRFARRMLEQQPENEEARELLGVSLLETGDISAAKEAFESLIQPPSPQPPPPSAHLYLVQLSEDDPRLALQHYYATVDILVNQLRGEQTVKNSVTTNPSDQSEFKNNITRALIGQVEMWMDTSYNLWRVTSSIVSSNAFLTTSPQL